MARLKTLLFFMRDALTALRIQGLRGIYCDIGANIGQHALFMSLCAERVHAFEPFPRFGAGWIIISH